MPCCYVKLYYVAKSNLSYVAESSCTVLLCEAVELGHAALCSYVKSGQAGTCCSRLLCQAILCCRGKLCCYVKLYCASVSSSMSAGDATRTSCPWHAACIPEQPDSLPEGLQDIIKGLNTIGGSSFSQGSNGQRCDGLHLLILVCQAVLDDVHQGLHTQGPSQPFVPLLRQSKPP